MRQNIGLSVLGVGAVLCIAAVALFCADHTPASTSSTATTGWKLPREVRPLADLEPEDQQAPNEQAIPNEHEPPEEHDPAPEGEHDGGHVGCTVACENSGADREGPAELHPVLGTTTNVLLLGLDRNPGVRRGGLTDTLIIAALDTDKRRLGLVSVPRDLYVSVENHGETRLNAVYALARKDKIPPADAFDRVLRDTLGVPIHHTVVVDLGLFERVIDELGGVDVEVPCPIQDRFIDPRVEGGRRALDVAAGRQHMDGVTAAMYVRSRHGRSDWNRARRQQAVLLALRNKVTDPSLLLQVPELLREWNDSVTTDLGPLAMLNLVRQSLGVKVQNLHGVVLGHKETFGKRTDANWSVLVPNNEAIASRLNDVYQSPAPGEGQEVCPDADVALRRRAKALAPSVAQSP